MSRPKIYTGYYVRAFTGHGIWGHLSGGTTASHGCTLVECSGSPYESEASLQLDGAFAGMGA